MFARWRRRAVAVACVVGTATGVLPGGPRAGGDRVPAGAPAGPWRAGAMFFRWLCLSECLPSFSSMSRMTTMTNRMFTHVSMSLFIRMSWQITAGAKSASCCILLNRSENALKIKVSRLSHPCGECIAASFKTWTWHVLSPLLWAAVWL